MGKGIQILGVLGVGAAALLIYNKFASLANFASYLTITPKLDGGLKGISLKGGKLTLPIALEFQNRTEQEVTLSVGTVMVYYKGKVIVTNKPTTKEVVIKGNATSRLTGIKMQITWLTLLSVGGTILNTWVTNGNLQPFVDDLTISIALTLNKSVVVDFTTKLGESKNIDTKKGGVNGWEQDDKTRRKISDFGMSEYARLVPGRDALRNDQLVVKSRGTVEDTLALMRKVAVAYRNDTARLAEALRKPELKGTLQSIFDFVYRYVKYVPDDRTREQVRRPLRTIWDQKGDCDCYATLVGQLLTNLRIDYRFRIAAYSGDYQHVYVVVKDPQTGVDYVVDPVMPKCFAEKKPTRYKDFECLSPDAKIALRDGLVVMN